MQRLFIHCPFWAELHGSSTTSLSVQLEASFTELRLTFFALLKGRNPKLWPTRKPTVMAAAPCSPLTQWTLFCSSSFKQEAEVHRDKRWKQKHVKKKKRLNILICPCIVTMSVLCEDTQVEVPESGKNSVCGFSRTKNVSGDSQIAAFTQSESCFPFSVESPDTNLYRETWNSIILVWVSS